jgi:hypothetical protein
MRTYLRYPETNRKAKLHTADEYRLDSLRRYGILDTPREDDFDEVVKVASYDTPPL